MREMGIAGIHPGPNLSKRHAAHQIYPYLLRNVTASAPNHIWGIDITYIRLRAGWMYLVAILDWYSRYVVSWALDDTLELPFVLHAVEHALTQARPEIWNSDQGSQFTSPQYTQRLEEAGVRWLPAEGFFVCGCSAAVCGASADGGAIPSGPIAIT